MLEILLWMIVCILVGFLAGMVVLSMVYKEKRKRDSMGYLRVDRSDPDGPFLFLELGVPITKITKQKYATFEIIDRSYVDPQD